MLLHINRNTDWKNLTIKQISPINKKDYSFYSSNEIQVFIYGYPYYENKDSWIKSENIVTDYNRYVLEFIKNIDGAFTIMIIDNIKEQLYIVSDIYRLYSLYYYYNSENEINISTKVSNIKQKKKDIDFNDLTIKEFLNFGFVMGTKTICKSINKFESAKIYSFNKQLQLNKKQYFEIKSTDRFSINDYFDEFNSHLSKGERLSEKISLPLTAGLDSRTILSGLLKYKNKIVCYTHGEKKSIDVKRAKNICKKLNLKHHYYSTNKNRDELSNAIHLLSENFEGMINSVLFAHLINSYSNQSKLATTLFNGNGGELLRYYYFSTDITNTNDFTNNIYKKLKLSHLPNNIYVDKLIEEKLKQSIQSEINIYSKEKIESMCNSFYLYNRYSNFSGFSLKLAGQYQNIFLPFISKKLLNILFNINPKTILSNELQSYIIKNNSVLLTKYLVNDYKICNNWNLLMLVTFFSMIIEKVFFKVKR